MMNLAFAESVPAPAEEIARPVRRQDELFVGRRAVWQLTVVVDRQITRRIVVADAKACSTSVVVLATEMVGNSAYRGKTIQLFCGASAPGETA